jgi:hypothetical protein
MNRYHAESTERMMAQTPGQRPPMSVAMMIAGKKVMNGISPPT